MKETILAINPGSTSTKIAVYDGETKRFETTLTHSAEDLSPFATITDQFAFRRKAIVDNLAQNGVTLEELDSIIGRGGVVYPLESGIYEVNKTMINDLHNPPMGEHASNLGGLIASDLAAEITANSGREVKAYIADPVVVDEMDEVARVAGHPLFTRVSIFHALNQKAIARRYAQKIGKSYEDLNLIIAHLGGGVSVGAHHNGRVVDVNNGLDGEGAMSPERSGTLPAGQLAKLCFSGKYTEQEVKLMIKGHGGMVAHLGTNDAREVEGRVAAGDLKAKLIYDAMCYNIGKMIGSMSAVLRGKVDAVIVTGGMARSKYIADYLSGMVGYIAPLEIYGGEDEMGALAFNALSVLRKEREPKCYVGKGA